MEVLNVIMQWVVAPVAAFVWVQHTRIQTLATDVAVMKAVQEANKVSHDREFKELRETLKTINAKLDSIEQAMRK